MKRWISVLAIVSLVVSLASVMSACKKSNGDDVNTTTPDDVQETVTEAEAVTYDDDLREVFEDLQEGYSEISTFEHTTNEHYEEDFAALTLPAAVPTTKAAKGAKTAATTQAARRETTTQFQFQSYTRGATTTKPGDTTAKSADGDTTTAVTTAAPETSYSDTTSMADRIGGSPTISNDELISEQRPNVTYLDKYVKNILNSGSYTLQAEIKGDGMAVPFTRYINADNRATKFVIGDALSEELNGTNSFIAFFAKQGEIRIIRTGVNSSNPRMYICWPGVPGGYCEITEAALSSELAGDGSQADDISDLFSDQDFISEIPWDALEYTGVTMYPGYCVESYKTANGALYRFYFDSQGIAKMEVIDPDTEQREMEIPMKLTSGVTDKKAFKPSGKEMDIEEFKKLLENIAL